MLDYLIKGATIVDGTGAPGRVGDVGVRDGRIVAVGEVDEEATTTLDAAGLVVTPGFVDPTRTTTPSCSGTRRRRRPTSTASPPSSAATAASRWPRSGPRTPTTSAA